MTTITDTQAVDMLNAIAEMISRSIGLLLDDDFIESNIEDIAKIVEVDSREAFVKVCDILGIEKVTD